MPEVRKGVGTLLRQTCAEIARRPVCWIGFFLLPLLLGFMLTNLMEQGLPTRIPAAVVDMDRSSTSRHLGRTLSAMQMVKIVKMADNYTQARRDMQSGEIYGYFVVPEHFEKDLLAGRRPVISFYTNMTYYVPANLLFKNFKLTAVYTKAGVMQALLAGAGVPRSDISNILSPVTIQTRPLGNPQLNYAIYLANSFLPCAFQLMIMLMTAFMVTGDIKSGFSRYNLWLAGGSVFKSLFGKLLPATVIWMVEIFFMYSLLYRWCHFPMHGSPGWMFLSEFLFVLAAQGLGLFIASVIPNMRLALSVCSLLGILSFSLGAFSFPAENMYGAIEIFSYILPTRYNFLIYIDQALNGIDIYYSRMWYVAYFIFILLPLPLLPRLKRAMANPVYLP